MKFLLLIFIFLFILSCEQTCPPQPEALNGSCNNKLEKQPRMEEGSWIFEGDSNVHLTNVKQWYGDKASNFAFSGSRTEHVIARIPDVCARKPEKVIVQVGGNDMLTFSSMERGYYQQYRTRTQRSGTRTRTRSCHEC